MSSKGLAGVIVAVVIAAAVAFWLGKSNSTTISEGSMVTAFQRMNELTVFRADVVTVPTSHVDGYLDILDRDQTDILRARVRYTIDLSKLTDQDVQWEPSTKTATVTIPPVVVQSPDMEGSSRRTFRTGPPAAAATWDKFSRSNAVKARREADQLARAPDLMRLAEQSARDAVTANALPFLRAANGPETKIIVQFATEGRSSDAVDRSRSPTEVLRESR